MKIAIYATAHGYGHASRSHQVARALVEKDPGITVHFSSAVADGFFAGEEHPRIMRRRRKLDVGIRQIDSLNSDVEGTLADLQRLSGDTEKLIEEEASFLRKNGIGIVLADLPHIAFEAAAEAGVPSWGLSNFSWDWIYEGYIGDFPDLAIHIERIRRAYGRADGLLRLPFHGDMAAFGKIIDLPLAARRSGLGMAEARRRLGFEGGRWVILLSFGGLRLKSPIQVSAQEDAILLCSDPSPDFGPPFMHISNEKRAALGLRYCDLVAAADLVVSKPGYGIVSECIANRTALLFTARGEFREYPVLVQQMGTYLPVKEIRTHDFKTGRWWKAAKSLLEQPFPPAVDCSGAEAASEFLLARLNG